MFAEDKFYLPGRANRGILEDAKSHARAMNYPRRRKGFFARLFGW